MINIQIGVNSFSLTLKPYKKLAAIVGLGIFKGG